APVCHAPCPPGTVSGPTACARPCFPPFNGVLPGRGPGFGGYAGGGGPPGFSPQGYPTPAAGPFGQGPVPPPSYPTHPYARSPRDYFMWGDLNEDRLARERLPILLR